MAVMKKEHHALTIINQHLEQGKSFAESVSEFIKPDLYYQLALAEKHGRLVETLSEIGTILIAKQQQRRKLQRLLQYPLLLLFLLGLLIVGLSTYVFPELASWQTGKERPFGGRLHQVLPVVGSLVLLVTALGTILLLKQWRKLTADQRVQWRCRLPVIGKSYQLYYGYYITGTLAVLLQCGMSLKEILTVIDNFSPQSLLFCLGQEVKMQVKQGGDLRQVILHRQYLPNELAVLINKGATVEELGADLAILAKMQFKRLINQLEGMLAMVQPVIFIVIALVIVCLYLSILLPIYQSIQGVY